MRRLDRYAARNAAVVLVADPRSGPRRAERAEEIQSTSQGAGWISRGAPWLVAVAAAAALLPAASAHAQDLDGYASVLFDVMPNQQTVEARARVFAEHRIDFSDRVRVTTAGFVEGLAADRGEHGSAGAAIVRPQELHVELVWPRADLRVGLSRVAWGRLDEFLPTDVVNPLDLARFFFEGRGEARMPVALIRGRVLPSERLTVEAIYVPFFRRGRFDQLDERSSPFNLVPRIAITTNEPADTLGNAQGGVRASVTSGRVDWSLSAYRGFEPFPEYETAIVSMPPDAPRWTIVESFRRFTMLGGDFETVRGEWGWRGEIAARGDRVEGGVGVDRRAGAFRISGNVLVRKSEIDTDTSIVAAVDRSFARETRQLRAFAVYNPADASAFARLIVSFGLRDNVTVETSGGLFTGDGDDEIGRLGTRDFAYARLKVFF